MANPNPTKLDQHQVLQRSFDEAQERLRVDAVASIESGSMEVVIDQSDDSILVYGNDGAVNRKVKTDASGTVSINDGGNSITVDGTVGITGTVPVSATSLPLPTGAATAALQTQPGVDIGDVTINNSSGGGAVNIQDGGNSITVDGSISVSNFPATQPVSAVSLPLPAGAATAALQTQPGVDIGDVTINNAAGASAVNIQDGGNSITVDGLVSTSQITSSTSSVTSVASSASSVQLLASNSSRKMAMFYNDSTKILYLKLGTTASNTSYTLQLVGGAYYELPSPVYTGRIDGIWASVNGNVRITELT